jgi:hypothetical protein
MAWIIIRGDATHTGWTLPWWGYVAFLIVPVQLLVRALAPPDVLLLHSFDRETYSFAKLLSRGLGSLSLSSLAEPFGAIASRHSLLGEIVATGVSGDRAACGVGTKTASDATWRTVVQQYMELADAIVVDVSDARSGVLEEIEYLTTRRDLLAKATFVCRDPSAAGTALALLRARVPENIDCYCYGQLAMADSFGGSPRILQNVFNQWLWTGLAGQQILSRTGARRRRGTRLALSLVVAVVVFAALHPHP